MMRGIAFVSFFWGFFPARSSQLAAVPGVGRGAGEIGGVGLPESTGGQGRIDWLALPATAQRRERRQQVVAFSFTGKSLSFNFKENLNLL